MQYKRKLLVLLICILIGVISSFIMELEQFRIFLDGVVNLSYGFFAGNAAEHISKSIGGRNGNKV